MPRDFPAANWLSLQDFVERQLIGRESLSGRPSAMRANEKTDDPVFNPLNAVNHSASQKLDLVRRLARERLLAIEAIASAGPEEKSPRFVYVLQRLARLCGAALVTLGAFVLFGWISRFDALRSLLPSIATIVPLKAVAFLFSGIAILLLTRRHRDETGHRFAEYLFALLPLAIGVITLFEYASGRSVIDLLLLPELVAGAGGENPGRMSVGAALNFTVAGSALLLLAFRIRGLGSFVTWSALFVFFSGLLSFLAFLFSTTDGATFSWFDSAAVHGSVGFLLLAVAIAFARPDLPLVRLIGGDSHGSKIARILFPAAILIPVLMGFGIVAAERARIFEPGVAGVFGAGSTVLLLFALIWLTAARLDRFDRLRIQESGRVRHSERLLRALVDATSDFVWAQSASVGRGYMEWWKELTGQTDEELEGYGWLEALHPDDRERVRSEWETAVATGSELRTIYRLRLKSGEYGVFSVRGIPVKDDAGNVVEWVGTFDDITKASQAEEAVRNSERKFRILAEAFEDNIWEVFSPDLENVDAPQWWKNLTGQSDDEVKNFGWLDAVHPEDADEAKRIIGEAFRKKHTFIHHFRVRRYDGVYRTFRIKCVPIFDEKGNFLQWIGGSRDITIEKEAEQRIINLNRQLLERTRELESLNTELAAFTYSVSHDLRAPLRAMEGFSAAIAEDFADKLDETGKNYISRIRAASLRMSDMIDALLTLSRLTRNPLEIETLDLSSMAEEIITLLRESQPGRKVEVSIAPGITGRGDRRLISLVLQNLLANAWKFTSKRQDAKIEFGMMEHAEEKVYFVRDNGVGFDMAYVHKLFGPFQRLHRADEFEGSGIGLATVQRIIRQHGGLVRAEGKPDGGAVFYFTLNVSESESE